MTLLQVASCTDSIGQGFGNYDIENGGKGCYVELAFEQLSNLAGVGPLVGPGFRGIWRDNAVTTTGGPEWSSAGSWTKTASTDAFDKGIGGYCYYSSAGSSATRTWTKPSQWRPCAGGICVEYVDTGGNWQYRINGGTWTNHGQPISNNNALKRFYLSGNIISIDFRAFDGSSAAAICLHGVEPYYVTPQGASGFIGHNLGLSGINLHDVALATSGDRLASFDTVTLGTGSPPSRQPSYVIIGPYSNDVPNINNSTTWGTDLTTLRNRVASFATVGIINVYEQGSGRNTTTQNTYRNQTKTTAAGFSPPAVVFDWADQWTGKLGLSPFATSGCTVDISMTGTQSGSLLGTQSLTVSTTAGFNTTGSFSIIGTNGTDQRVTYSGIDSTHFLNCRLVNGADFSLTGLQDLVVTGQFLESQLAPALCDAGAVHPSQLGYLDLADRVYWWLRTQLAIGASTFPSSFVASGKLASVAYGGRLPTVAYGASLIGVR